LCKWEARSYVIERMSLRILICFVFRVEIVCPAALFPIPRRPVSGRGRRKCCSWCGSVTYPVTPIAPPLIWGVLDQGRYKRPGRLELGELRRRVAGVQGRGETLPGSPLVLRPSTTRRSALIDAASSGTGGTVHIWLREKKCKYPGQRRVQVPSRDPISSTRQTLPYRARRRGILLVNCSLRESMNSRLPLGNLAVQLAAKTPALTTPPRVH